MSGAPYTVIQHFNYDYQGGSNRLITAQGLSGTDSREYTYDANGNVLTDDSKGLLSTVYGRASYPFHLELDSDNDPLTEDDKVSYLYSVNDSRVYKKVETLSGIKEDYYLTDGMGKTIALYHSNNGTGEWEYYIHGSEREARLVPSAVQQPGSNSGNTDLRFKKDQVAFFVYDHLGNTRLTFTTEAINVSTTTTIVNRIDYIADYYPYGKVLREFVNGEQERYLTTQHERDAETGLDYRGARYYDSDIARFLSLDPLATEFPAWSAYNYVVGNPVSLIDPSGRAPEDPPNDGVKVKKNGKIKHNRDIGITAGGPFVLPNYAVALYATFWDNTEYKTETYESYEYLSPFYAGVRYDEPSSMQRFLEVVVPLNKGKNEYLSFGVNMFHYKKKIDENFHLAGGYNELSLNAIYYERFGNSGWFKFYGGGLGAMMLDPSVHGHVEGGYADPVQGSGGWYQLGGIGASGRAGISWHTSVASFKRSSIDFQGSLAGQIHINSTKNLKAYDGQGNVIFNQPYRSIGGGLIGGIAFSFNF